MKHYNGCGSKLQTSIDRDVRVCLNEYFFLSEAERNYLVTDSRTVLQEQRELRAEGFVVDITEVSEPRAFELETVDIVHRKPASINFLDSIFDY